MDENLVVYTFELKEGPKPWTERNVKEIDEAFDSVDHPHYYCRGGIEVYDIEEWWELDRYTAPAVEYILRSKYKGNELEDLKKAVNKLQRKIREMEDNETE